MRPFQNSQETAGLRWDATVQVYLSSPCHVGLGWCRADRDPPSLTKDYYIAVVRRAHRLFQPGDVVILNVTNGGGERWPAYGLSGRGYKVAGLYVQYCKYWRKNNDFPGEFRRSPGLVELVEVPEGLKGLPPAAPDVRRFVVRLSSEAFRTRVSSNSPVSSAPAQTELPPLKNITSDLRIKEHLLKVSARLCRGDVLLQNGHFAGLDKTKLGRNPPEK